MAIASYVSTHDIDIIQSFLKWMPNSLIDGFKICWDQRNACMLNNGVTWKLQDVSSLWVLIQYTHKEICILAACSDNILLCTSQGSHLYTISQIICSGGISNRNGKITAITHISANFKLLQVPFFFNKYRSRSAGIFFWLIFWWAGTFFSNSPYCSFSTYKSLAQIYRDSAGIPKRFYELFSPPCTLCRRLIHAMLPQ